MKKVDSIFMTERVASFYLYFISFLGLISISISLFEFQIPSHPTILVLLLIFMGIAEYFPVRFWRGFSSLNFPIFYAMSWQFGTNITVIALVFVTLIIHLLRRSPMERILFNGTQHALSLILAEWCSNECMSLLVSGMNMPVLYEKLTFLLLFSMFFSFFNNLFYDLLMVLLPQPYSIRQWYKKTVTVFLCETFCLFYAALMHILDSQYSVEINEITVLFFFFPLAAISVISSFSVRIRIEKERLYELFLITTEISRGLSGGNLKHIKQSLKGFFGIQAYVIWTKDDGDWNLLLKDGKLKSDISNYSDIYGAFEEISKNVVFNDWKAGMAPGDEVFDDVIRSIAYFPLIVNNELVGMFVAGKSRNAGFFPEDVQSLATFSNQLANVVKTRILISEQEKRMILEERNRIAREIHDGIAQALAGVIFQLESAQKKYCDKPIEMQQVVEKSIRKLRSSLGEIRYSIYALKPYPTQQLGLKQAIASKIKSLKQEYELDIRFNERGHSRTLSFSKERAIFDTFQESLQNIVKHAKAEKVNVLLSYQREHVLLKVKDNGIGFSLFESMVKTKCEPHYGILHMNEQAEQLGATLQIDSSVGKGTEITLLIPDSQTRGA
ncbi:GAF domain-containing sensor histidine kinase [Bacillus sp. DX1.1]|uniref:GAF domain-containing sensor histidine kinase n=1 Tax=unclassified Bacillus (in: firmicutes) TaxID=185979 RepID=UPI00257116E5|nr:MULTISPECIES: GAF domain-containing sensor histidine kinase [unclassified Bacillus (in: firmicutes)]MDM5153435.1 GAF domain-containing sensor histidine kinase [Bacillus sp. DX1.1]WJE82390.1 GAF domain-containing sensor histidine kinase [Bacillus sp. DX3.1]